MMRELKLASEFGVTLLLIDKASKKINRKLDDYQEK